MLRYLVNYITSVFSIESKFKPMSSFHPEAPVGVGSKFSNKSISYEGK